MKNAQLRRAFEELEIEGILANSPQAKGRVERVNRTLQDRLIKEMRLQRVSNIEEGNAFLEEYLEIHNKKFSKEPRGQIDTHRPLDDTYDLQYILTRRESRKVSKNLSISFGNKKINIVEPKISNRLKGQKVNVIERENGEIEVYWKGKRLKTSLFEEIPHKVVFDLKDKVLWKPNPKSPGSNHPWKRCGRQRQYV